MTTNYKLEKLRLLIVEYGRIQYDLGYEGAVEEYCKGGDISPERLEGEAELENMSLELRALIDSF